MPIELGSTGVADGDLSISFKFFNLQAMCMLVMYVVACVFSSSLKAGGPAECGSIMNPDELTVERLYGDHNEDIIRSEFCRIFDALSEGGMAASPVLEGVDSSDEGRASRVAHFREVMASGDKVQVLSLRGVPPYKGDYAALIKSEDRMWSLGFCFVEDHLELVSVY